MTLKVLLSNKLQENLKMEKRHFFEKCCLNLEFYSFIEKIKILEIIIRIISKENSKDIDQRS